MKNSNAGNILIFDRWKENKIVVLVFKKVFKHGNIWGLLDDKENLTWF